MQNLSVLVTGAGGKIGRRLVPILVNRGHRVVASSRNAANLPGCESVAGDLMRPAVRDAALAALVKQDGARCAVIHLAGLADAAVARANRTLAFDANVQLVQSLLDASVAHGVRRFLLASSGLVYGHAAEAPIVEDAPVRPSSVYAATKLAAEVLVQGYTAEGLLRGEIMRLSNVYGPDSPENTVSGRILAQLRRREPIAVASRQPVRDFIFVDDVLTAICGLLENEAADACGIVNISSGIGVSIGQMADAAESIASGAPPRPENDAGLADRIVLANDRLRARFGWRPRYTILEGLRASLQETAPNF